MASSPDPSRLVRKPPNFRTLAYQPRAEPVSTRERTQFPVQPAPIALSSPAITKRRLKRGCSRHVGRLRRRGAARDGGTVFLAQSADETAEARPVGVAVGGEAVDGIAAVCWARGGRAERGTHAGAGGTVAVFAGQRADSVEVVAAPAGGAALGGR